MSLDSLTSEQHLAAPQPAQELTTAQVEDAENVLCEALSDWNEKEGKSIGLLRDAAMLSIRQSDALRKARDDQELAWHTCDRERERAERAEAELAKLRAWKEEHK